MPVSRSSMARRPRCMVSASPASRDLPADSDAAHSVRGARKGSRASGRKPSTKRRGSERRPRRCARGRGGAKAITTFVQEAVDEALTLEAALARLRTQKRVALLHYSPIRATVEGEPPEIFPYLGSSRLEEPINRYRVSAVFHGHAHRGTPEGRTSTGIPVHNVSMPLLQRVNPDRPPFLIVEVPLDEVDTAVAVEPRGQPLVKSA